MSNHEVLVDCPRCDQRTATVSLDSWYDIYTGTYEFDTEIDLACDCELTDEEMDWLVEYVQTMDAED